MECEELYIFNNSLCELCSKRLYYDYDIKSCLACPELCTECTSKNLCLECKSNCTVGNDNICLCNIGFTQK